MSKRIHIITLFPDLFHSFFNYGIIARAVNEKGFNVNLVDLKNYSPRHYKGVDDAPYGGGPGRVLRADVLKKSLCQGVLEAYSKGREDIHVILPSPRGPVLSRDKANHIGETYFVKPEKDLVFICGRYEGPDERFITNYVDEEISLGNFILLGGEVATMAILESAFRFVPGMLGNPLSAKNDSFENGLLEEPVYTRPSVFEGRPIPKVLLSGNHSLIKNYREKEKIRVTRTYRPDIKINHYQNSR